MVTCCVPGCKKRTQKGLTGVTFHRFPKDEELKRAWLEAIGRRSWEPTIFSKICSLHFNDDDFNKQKSYTRLKDTSIPSKHVDKIHKAQKRSEYGMFNRYSPSEREQKLMDKIKYLREILIEKNKLISVLRVKIRRRDERLFRIKVYNASSKKRKTLKNRTHSTLEHNVSPIKHEENIENEEDNKLNENEVNEQKYETNDDKPIENEETKCPLKLEKTSIDIPMHSDDDPLHFMLNCERNIVTEELTETWSSVKIDNNAVLGTLEYHSM